MSQEYKYHSWIQLKFLYNMLRFMYEKSGKEPILPPPLPASQKQTKIKTKTKTHKNNNQN